ncbi:MAG TPA: hypothetical protein VFR87_00625 [Nocardioidaceae bacterium]|nr:hypothetical protein [Nocardioidaceae bacterium]
MLPRLLVAVLVLTSVVGCSGPAHAPAGVPARLVASDVLRSWDEARARAFAEGDLAALQRLYVPGSAAGTADVGMLRAYLDRGLRVEGMRMQVLALDVLSADGRRLRLRVTDRLADGAVAVGAGTAVALPEDAASTRVVELVGSGNRGWRVASVRE